MTQRELVRREDVPLRQQPTVRMEADTDDAVQRDEQHTPQQRQPTADSKDEPHGESLSTASPEASPGCNDGSSRGSACVELDDVFDRTSSAGSLLRAQLGAPQPPSDDTLSRAPQSGATAHAAAGRGGSDGGDGNNDGDGGSDSGGGDTGGDNGAGGDACDTARNGASGGTDGNDGAGDTASNGVSDITDGDDGADTASNGASDGTGGDTTSTDGASNDGASDGTNDGASDSDSASDSASGLSTGRTGEQRASPSCTSRSPEYANRGTSRGDASDGGTSSASPPRTSWDVVVNPMLLPGAAPVRAPTRSSKVHAQDDDTVEAKADVGAARPTSRPIRQREAKGAPEATTSAEAVALRKSVATWGWLVVYLVLILLGMVVSTFIVLTGGKSGFYLYYNAVVMAGFLAPDLVFLYSERDGAPNDGPRGKNARLFWRDMAKRVAYWLGVMLLRGAMDAWFAITFDTTRSGKEWQPTPLVSVFGLFLVEMLIADGLMQVHKDTRPHIGKWWVLVCFWFMISQTGSCTPCPFIRPVFLLLYITTTVFGLAYLLTVTHRDAPRSHVINGCKFLVAMSSYGVQSFVLRLSSLAMPWTEIDAVMKAGLLIVFSFSVLRLVIPVCKRVFGDDERKLWSHFVPGFMLAMELGQCTLFLGSNLDDWQFWCVPRARPSCRPIC